MDIIITSLESHFTNSASNRHKLIQKNKELYPQIQIYKSINGFNPEEVISALKKSNIKLFNISFKTWGTLACFLTKIMVWKKQIEEQIPYLCLLEDDLELNENFLPFINEHKHELDNENVNILRCADWGECYITSLESAKRLIALLEKNGIWKNADEQLWECNEKVINHSKGGGWAGIHGEDTWINGFWEHVGYKHDIFKLHKQTNKGDILKTGPISELICETLFLGNSYDMKPYQIAKIIEKTTDNKNFLSFGLNGMCVHFLKELDARQSLTSYEYGNSLAKLVEFKNKIRISDEKFIVNDLCFYNNQVDYKLYENLNKSYGSFAEEYQPNVILNIYSKIDYKKYDAFIVNGFARGFLIFYILQNANKGSKIFLSNTDRDWYDWVLDERNIQDIDLADFKLIIV